MASHSGTPATANAPRSGGRHQASGQAERDAHQIRRASRSASARTRRTTRGGKPSIAGHAAGGAATGASLGAAAGSVVPGVGTAIGAGVGAATGAGAGAVGGMSARRRARLAGRSPATRALVAEFVVCTLILALSPMTDKHKSDTPGVWMKRATGVSALFIALGLVASIGPKAGRVAVGFGGLVLVTLAVSDRDVFAKIALRFGGPVNSGPAGPDSGKPWPGQGEAPGIQPPASMPAGSTPNPGARPVPGTGGQIGGADWLRGVVGGWHPAL